MVLSTWLLLLLDIVLAFRYCRPHFYSLFLLSFLMILNINKFSLGGFCVGFVKDKNEYNDNLPKQNNSLQKSSHHSEPRIPMCPLNCTQNRKVEDLVDTPDPKDEMETIQIQSPRPLRSSVQLIHTEKLEWYSILRNRKTSGPSPFGSVVRGTDKESKTKKLSAPQKSFSQDQAFE